MDEIIIKAFALEAGLDEGDVAYLQAINVEVEDEVRRSLAASLEDELRRILDPASRHQRRREMEGS